MEKNWRKTIGLVHFDETRRYLEGLGKKVQILMRELEPN